MADLAITQALGENGGVIRLMLLALGLLSCGCSGDEAGWTSLFDGKSLAGWTPNSEANWRVEDGSIVVDKGKKGLLLHECPHQDYLLVVEFKADKGTNSGIFLRTDRRPGKVATDCYELNIAPPDNPFPTGSLVARKKHEGAGDSGQWRTFKVRIEKGHVSVELDGKQILDYRAERPPGGELIGLQLNSGKVGFRNIRIRRLP